MLRIAQLYMIGGVLLGVDLFAALITMITRFSVEVWRNNVMRRWVLNTLNDTARLIGWVARYLEDLQTRIQYRALYESMTRPLKSRYRKLKRNPH